MTLKTNRDVGNLIAAFNCCSSVVVFYCLVFGKQEASIIQLVIDNMSTCKTSGHIQPIRTVLLIHVLVSTLSV